MPSATLSGPAWLATALNNMSKVVGGDDDEVVVGVDNETPQKPQKRLLLRQNNLLGSKSSNNKKKLFQRTASITQDYVERIVQESLFLQTTPCDPSIAYLNRNQLNVGKMVGEGSFSVVKEVHDFEKFALHHIHSSSQSSTQSWESSTDNPQDSNTNNKSTTLKRGAGNLFSKLTTTIPSSSKNRRPKDDNDPEKHRYVIKHVHPKLLQHHKSQQSSSDNHNKTNTPTLFDNAASDLMVEALFLSKFYHPNIIALRGMAQQGPSSFANHGDYDGFFFITDYLPSTLDQRLLSWQVKQHEQAQKVHQSTLQQQNNDDIDLVCRIKYSLQVAQALHYLHERRLIYRDVKPQNIGFTQCNQSGVDMIQLFDFGFCRELPDEIDAVQVQKESKVPDRYNMTTAGTPRYMAGEILNGEPYNTKADVYSWAILAYEMWTLHPAYPNFDQNKPISEHIDRVCIQAKRPGLKHYNLPPPLERLLRKSWMRNVYKRFTMGEVVEELEVYLASIDHK